MRGMMRGTMRWAGTLLAVLVMAGCGGNAQGEGPGGSEDFVRVVVQNDGTIPTQVRVRLVPLSGPEINLGSMSTLGAETLTARAPVIRGRYVLRAEGGTDYRLTSPAVDLRGSDTIVWDMRLNQVRLQQQ